MEQHPHDERRDQIKRAALRVFAQRGIAGTKMSMIAAEAGISQGLSYRYFDSKEELFTLLVQEAVEEAQVTIRSLHLLPGTPKEQIRALTCRMLDASHRDHFLLLQHAQRADEVPERAKQLIERYSPQETIEHLIPIMTKGQATGEFAAGDPARLLFLYLSVLTGLILQQEPSHEGFWFQEVERLMKLLER